MPTPLIFNSPRHARHWRFKQRDGTQQLPPEPLAENLDPQAALIALRHNMTLRKPEGHLLSAWSHVEYAMNRQINVFDDQLRRKYMDDATYLLAGIMGVNGISRARTDTRLYTDALVLSSHLPVFTKRALGRTVLRADVDSIYQSNGFILNHLLRSKTEGEGSYRKTKVSETLARALAARTKQPDMLMYPASPREEGSPSPNQNHDSYFIKHRRKLPIQKKLISVEKQYDFPIQVLLVEHMTFQALALARVEIDESVDFPATAALGSIVAEETDGTRLNNNETKAINFATRSVAAKFRSGPIAA